MKKPYKFTISVPSSSKAKHSNNVFKVCPCKLKFKIRWPLTIFFTLSLFSSNVEKRKG